MKPLPTSTKRDIATLGRDANKKLASYRDRSPKSVREHAEFLDRIARLSGAGDLTVSSSSGATICFGRCWTTKAFWRSKSSSLRTTRLTTRKAALRSC